MRKSPRRYILIMAIISALLFILLFHRTEPRYHDQPVTYWITQLQQGDRKGQDEARDALKRMGKSAVPTLVRTLEKHDSRIKLKVLSFAPRFPILYSWFQPTMPQWNQYAASALGVIGPPASNAIPALLRASSTNTLDTYAPAKAALMKIRNEPLAPLIAALNDAGATNWPQNVAIVQEFGPDAQAAIPALCQALKLSMKRNWWPAAQALGRIHSDAATCVPALIEAIQQDKIVNTTWALGQFETEAKSAIPVLEQQLMKHSSLDSFARPDILYALSRIIPPAEKPTLVAILVKALAAPDVNVRKSAAEMLKQIDPEAAAKAGVR